jgi:hypothetical protein
MNGNKLCAFMLGSAMMFAALPAAGMPAPAFPGVLTWHNDNARTGQNLFELSLTPRNVNVRTFGKLFSRRVDGIVYAQPLFVPAVSIPGSGMHDVVYVATEHDSIYAFDAGGDPAAPLWHRSFIDPAHGITTMPCTSDQQPECDVTILTPEHGITATPVVDLERQTLYVVAKTVEHGEYMQRIHALDIVTGRERPGSPREIAASAPGFPAARFNGKPAMSRSGLVLDRGIVYASFASNDDDRGWMLGFDADSLVLRSVYCVTPTGNLGAIWGGGAAPAVDAMDNLYFMTGNGTFDADKRGIDLGMSMVKVHAGHDRLDAIDYFTEFNWKKLSNADMDLASGGVTLLPDQPGAHRHEIIGAGKEGKIFLVDRDAMGHFDPDNNDQIVQTIIANPGGYYSSPSYFNGFVYYAGVGDNLRQYAILGGKLSYRAVAVSPVQFNYPGSTVSISSNGAADGIVWAIAVSGRPMGGPPAVLYAFRADDVSKELYDSTQAGGRDRAGEGTKFSVPTVAASRVYVGTQTELDVYGLLP